MAVSRPTIPTIVQKTRNMSSAKGFVIILAVLLILFGAPALWFSYEGKQAEKIFNSISQPSWQMTKIDKYGNRFCDLTCIGQSRTYIAPEVTRENALQLFISDIEKNGFKIIKKSDQCTQAPHIDYTLALCNVQGEKEELFLSMTLGLIDKSDQATMIVDVNFGHDSYLFGLFKDK